MLHQDPPARGRDKHGDYRKPITSARQVAEALFTPNPNAAERSVREISPTADQPLRKPRVLAIASPVPARAEEREAPIRAKRQREPKIPKSQFPRVRTWVMYGMTAPEVAEVCGVSVEEIERILRKA